MARRLLLTLPSLTSFSTPTFRVIRGENISGVHTTLGRLSVSGVSASRSARDALSTITCVQCVAETACSDDRVLEHNCYLITNEELVKSYGKMSQS